MKKNVLIAVAYFYSILFSVCMYAEESTFPLEKAIALSLENNLDVKTLQSQVRQGAAALQIAIGTTDFTLGTGVTQTRSVQSYDKDDYYSYSTYYNGLKNDSTEFSVWLQKQFNFGLTMKTTLDYQRTEQKFWNADTKEWIGVNQRYGYADHFSNVGSADIALTLPLNKSFKNSEVDTAIEIKKVQKQMVENSFDAGVSQIVLKTATAYWDYWYAVKKLSYYRIAEKRMTDLADSVKKLAEAGERAKYEYTLMTADLSSYSLNCIIAEQELTAARNALASAMGISVPDTENLGEPTDGMPEIDRQAGLSIDVRFAVNEAKKNRPDLLSLQQRAVAAGLQMKQAAISTKPDFNLNLGLGYKGAYFGDSLAEGLTRSFSDNVITPGFSGGFSFQLDLGTKNKGTIHEAEEGKNQAELEVQKLEQQIEYDVEMQALNIQKYLEIMKKSYETMMYYSKTVDDETVKLTSGYSTVADLTSVQDKQINASVRYAESIKQFADAIFTYKYTIGKISDGIDNHQKVYSVY